MAVTAYKLYVKENYFYMDEVVDAGNARRFEALAKDVLVRTMLTNSDTYAFTGVNGAPTTEISFDILQDENGDPWTDQETFETWYQTNLGKSNGGDTPSNTSVVGYSTGETATDGQTQFIVPANTVITSVTNSSLGELLNPTLDWSQAGAGESVLLNNPAIADEVYILSGFTYADVTPPTYKRYVFSFAQTGTDNPVVVPFINTLGGTPVWTRTGVGVYQGVLASAFAGNVSTLPFSATLYYVDFDGTAGYINFRKSDDDTLLVTTTTILGVSKEAILGDPITMQAEVYN
jgi:hypothetical protein